MEKHSIRLKEVNSTEYYCDICEKYIGVVVEGEESDNQLFPSHPGFISIKIPSISIIIKQNERNEGKSMQYVKVLPEESDKEIYYYEGCLCESCKEKKIKELQDKINQFLKEL